MMIGKFIDSNTVTGTQIRLDNNQWFRGRNFADSADINILKITTTNLIEFKSIPYVEGQGRLALYSEIDGILTFVEYLYGQLSEVTEDISTIQSDIVTIQSEIDNLQTEAGDFALKDLSNLTATAIPDGVNLESVSIIQDTDTSFSLRTKNQTASVSGRIFVRTGDSQDGFISGGINIQSGANLNADGVDFLTPLTGANVMISGSITTGIRGSTGSGFVRSGTIAISTAISYSGNTGSVGTVSGTISSNVSGATVSGTTGFGSLTSGSVMVTASGASATAGTGGVLVSSGGISSGITGANVIGNSGGATLASGSVSGGAITSGTSTSNSGGVTVNSGAITNVNNTGNTGGVTIRTGLNSGIGNSGSVNISTGTVSSGNRGNINLTAPLVQLTQNSRLVLQDTTGDRLVRLQLSNGITDGDGQFFFNRIRSDKTIYIGAMESHVNDNGAPVYFSGTFILSSIDGQYKSSDVYLQSNSYANFQVATNVAISTGDVYIRSESSFVQGTETDANTGNITLQTGTAQGSGTRGFISLDGDYVTASSTQIKNVADPTDPQDALTLNYFNNNVPSVVEFDFYPLQAYNTYATIYANGASGILDPVTPTNPRAGWYFKNSGTPDKINWYFFDGNIISCQLQNFSAFAVVTFDSIASLPFFSFYTFPTGSGDIIPGFAHSRIVYSTPYVPSAVAGTKYLIYFGNDPQVFPYLPRIQLTYNAVASGGDQGPTELVSTAALATDSGASANQVQVMVENLGLNLSNFKAYFDLLIFPVFEESQDYYGSFYSSQSQDNLVPDIARAMTFNNTDEANGVSIVSTSQITFATGGLYNIQFSAQFTHSNSSSQDVDIWLAKNGVNVPYTNSRETLAGQVSVISAWNFFVRVNSGEYVEIYWSSPSNDVVIEYTGTQTVPTRPETPSIILTVNKIIS